MSGWQVGDKAVYVGGACDYCDSVIPCPLTEGAAYTVVEVDPCENEPDGLDFAEAPADSDMMWCECSFRKIRPDAHEGNAEDWQLLLNSIKSPVPTHVSGEGR